MTRSPYSLTLGLGTRISRSEGRGDLLLVDKRYVDLSPDRGGSHLLRDAAYASTGQISRTKRMRLSVLSTVTDAAIGSGRNCASDL